MFFLLSEKDICYSRISSEWRYHNIATKVLLNRPDHPNISCSLNPSLKTRLQIHHGSFLHLSPLQCFIENVDQAQSIPVLAWNFLPNCAQRHNVIPNYCSPPFTCSRFTLDTLPLRHTWSSYQVTNPLQRPQNYCCMGYSSQFSNHGLVNLKCLTLPAASKPQLFEQIWVTTWCQLL